MKKTLLLSIFAFVVLAGCGNSGTVDNGSGTVATGSVEVTDTATGSNSGKTTPSEFRFGMESCDQYTKLMECVIDKIPAASRADTIDQYENVIKMWKQFSGADLKSICDQTITALQDTKESFEKIGCNL